MVTIYNGGLGLVKDVRDARFPEGTSEIQFADVAAQIDPIMVHLKSLTAAAGLRIIEQNYEYDLLTSQKLMEKWTAYGLPVSNQKVGVYLDVKNSNAVNDALASLGARRSASGVRSRPPGCSLCPLQMSRPGIKVRRHGSVQRS